MRLVLGETYEKYETFNIYLYQINQTGGLSASTPIANLSQLLADIRMKGLPFLNNTYNAVSRSNTNTAYLTAYVLNNAINTAAGTVTPMFNPSILTFSKHVECVNIKTDMKALFSQQYPTITVPNGAQANSLETFIFMFKRYGIPKRDNIITNGTRM